MDAPSKFWQTGHVPVGTWQGELRYHKRQSITQGAIGRLGGCPAVRGLFAPALLLVCGEWAPMGEGADLPTAGGKVRSRGGEDELTPMRFGSTDGAALMRPLYHSGRPDVFPMRRARQYTWSRYQSRRV